MEENTVIQNEKIKTKKKGANIWVKTGAFIAGLLLSLVIPVCAIIAVYAVDHDYYTQSFQDILREAMHQQICEDEVKLAERYMNGDESAMEAIAKQGNIIYAELREHYSRNGKDSEILWNWGDEKVTDTSLYSYTDTITYYGKDYKCRIALGYDLSNEDAYRNIFLQANMVYSLRYSVYFIALFAFIACVFLLIFLLVTAGYNGKNDEPKPCFESKIPFEISILVTGLILMALVGGTYFAVSEISDIIAMVAIIAAPLLFETVVVLWLICLAIRIKTGYVWRTMVLRYIIKGIRWLFAHIPVIWQALVFCLGTGFLFFMSKRFSNRYFLSNYYIAGWIIFFVAGIAAFVFIMYLAYSYNKMYKMTEDLANGTIPEDVNTKYMIPVFKKHAANIHTISEGVVISNEKRFASEKTQAALITNVSHDIKTPLTSIINYADLIVKEDCSNERINEYAEVLGRQSKRLKRLLEDLIEVSKAQSGALEINLEPCLAATFLTQSAGEYEERLEKKNLTVITKNTESNAMIMADPRRMWRVFDNLLGNICKYSLEGTRVYLTLEEDAEKCRIIFKNTSESELDMSPDELMKRFVRGDVSREGDGGNGLGLSIASNLVTLQKGTMDISIDGDLFKVTLEFGKIRGTEDGNQTKTGN